MADMADMADMALALNFPLGKATPEQLAQAIEGLNEIVGDQATPPCLPGIQGLKTSTSKPVTAAKCWAFAVSSGSE